MFYGLSMHVILNVVLIILMFSYNNNNYYYRNWYCGVVVSAYGDACIAALFQFYSYLISRSGKYYRLRGN